MNWGWKLAIASAAFMSLIIYFVVQSFNSKTQLVSNNYYEEELKYQEQIDAKKNARDLEDSLFVTQNASDVVIDYPAIFSQQGTVGQIYFYKPSNEKEDKLIKFSEIDGQQIIPKSLLTLGRYQVKIDLAVNDKKYFFDKYLIIQ